jgi:hypothetical protein
MGLRRMRALLLGLAIIGLVPLSGCMSDDGEDQSVAGKVGLQGRAYKNLEEIRSGAFEEIRGLMNGVPCTASVSATETSKNLKKLSNLSFEGGKGSKEIDIRGDIAVSTNSFAAGFSIFNISRPHEPFLYATVKEAIGSLDVKITPDGMTALVGGGRGIDLFDIRNPFEPVRVGQWLFSSVPSAPNGPSGGSNQNAHMLFTTVIKDQTWVFLAPNSNTGVWILKLEGAPEARSLKFVTNTLPAEGGPLGPHDMYVQYDADLKKHVLYSADGFHGWAAFDVSDPAKPTLIGGLIRPETGYTHTIQAAKIGGKRIVTTIAEVGVNLLEVYDATNLMAPVLLGTWHVTVSSMNPQPAAPQHNLNIVAGKLYVAHYANGIYVFDLTKVATPVASTSELKPIAHYGPGAPVGTPTLFSQFYDVVLKDGIVYGSSMSDGIHVVGFGCTAVGDGALTSDG